MTYLFHLFIFSNRSKENEEDDELTSEDQEEDRNNKMLALFGWFLLLSQLFTATQDYGIPDEILPGIDFYVPIINAMEDRYGIIDYFLIFHNKL